VLVATETFALSAWLRVGRLKQFKEAASSPTPHETARNFVTKQIGIFDSGTKEYGAS
jgi:hypothetical protein